MCFVLYFKGWRNDSHHKSADNPIEYYLDHVAEEHEYMKSHRPEDNPDVRPM